MGTYRPHLALRIAAAVIPFFLGLWIWINILRIIIKGDERLNSLSADWVVFAFIILIGGLCPILVIRSFLLAVELTPDSIRLHRLLRTRNVKIRDVFNFVQLHNSEGDPMGYGLQDKSGRCLAKISVIHNQVEMIEEIKSQVGAVKETALRSNASDHKL